MQQVTAPRARNAHQKRPGRLSLLSAVQVPAQVPILGLTLDLGEDVRRQATRMGLGVAEGSPEAEPCVQQVAGSGNKQ
jgi:hypothetical protein